MENRYPLFAGRRILKKESLWDVRDYTFAGWQLYYNDYTDGVLSGCTIRAEKGILVIGRGMLKYQDFVYLLPEEERIPYQPEDAWRALKAECSVDDTQLDYKAYQVRFFLDSELELKENQIEMCRFYLREGSMLRDSYKSFSDMATQYDTVNLIHATVAGVGEKTLHPAIMRQFAEELWRAKEKDPFDFNVCNLIWNTQGKVERRVVAAYLSYKMGKDPAEERLLEDNQEIYENLEKVIDRMGRFKKEKGGSRFIIVD